MSQGGHDKMAFGALESHCSQIYNNILGHVCVCIHVHVHVCFLARGFHVGGACLGLWQDESALSPLWVCVNRLFLLGTAPSSSSAWHLASVSS